MRIRLYRSSKGGWYLYGNNYKDKEDKAYCNVFFPSGTDEPLTTGDYIDINIIEAKGTSYKNKFGLTIFKYEILDETQLATTPQQEAPQEEMIGKQEIVITQEELPFY